MKLPEIFRRLYEKRLSPEMALLYLILETENIEMVRQAIEENEKTASADAGQRLEELRKVFWENREGCERIVAMLRSGMDTDAPAPSVSDGIAFSQRLFDWSVRQNEEASVALYSFCNPRILRRATDEIVDKMKDWHLLGERKVALEIGCGLGRFQEALSPFLGEVIGIDVSSRMIEVAQRRCAGFSNVRLDVCSGLDLKGFSDASLDLVFAVDSFPYLHQSGMSLVEDHFREIRRVLKPKSDFLILNFSYRDNDLQDREDVDRLARKWNFQIIQNGDRPFSLWDGAVFQMRLLSES